MSLANYDLTLVFGCAVELAEATASYRPEEHADILAKSPPHRVEEDPDAVWRWHDALDAIELASNRLKRALGAKGPLDAADYLRDQSTPTWEGFRSHFKYSTHPPTVRQALCKLATAAIDLSGYASVQVPEPFMRERGLRLLQQGLAQLWQGMTTAQRAEVKPLLPRTHAALGWPATPTAEPARYDGPEGIAVADQYRVIDATGGFAARTPDFLNEQQRLLSAAYPCPSRPSGRESISPSADCVGPRPSPIFDPMAERKAEYATPPPTPAAGTVPPSPPDPWNVCTQAIEAINQMHRLAVRCINVVLRLHYLRHCFDGAGHGLAALNELCDVVRESPSLPLAEDPFCREEVVAVTDMTATSAHVAAFAIAQRTWDAVHLTSLGAATGSSQGEGEGTPYTRTTFEVRRRSPTEVSWSSDVWQKVCQGLDDYPAPDADWFQAALALERTQVSRRLDQWFAAGSDVVSTSGIALMEIDPAASGAQQQADDAPCPEMTAPNKATKTLRDKKLEARDKWIYKQCCAAVAYKEIRTRLKAFCQNKGWRMIDSIQGIRIAATRYAERHDKPALPNRQNL